VVFFGGAFRLEPLIFSEFAAHSRGIPLVFVSKREHGLKLALMAAAGTRIAGNAIITR
jgi:hypothetical protein